LLIVGVIGFGVWRAAFAALARGAWPRGIGRLGIGLGLGVLLGRMLSFQSSLEDLDLLPDLAGPSAAFRLELLWSLQFLACLFLFLRWVLAGASTWLEIALTSRSPGRLCAVGVAIAGGLLAVWLGLSIANHDTFLALFALEDDVIGVVLLIGNYLLAQPLVLLALIVLWAFPLAAWFWRRPPTPADNSSWALLDPAPQRVTLLPQALLRPRLALLAGLAGGAIYCGLVLMLRIWWRWGLSEATRSDDQARLLLYFGQVALAALLQMGVAAVVAGWVQRLGALHGLFAAFVAGCVMTVAMLGLNLAFGGTIDFGFAWQTFSLVVNGGALLALPIGLVVAGLAGWIRRAQPASGARSSADAALL
jgi:hypothetical protein